MPAISIIVPVYKVEKYIHRCLESILGQTFSDFELILVDDGSPDNCSIICDEFKNKDNRVKVMHQKNQGQATARNRALDIATGEYIAFVDSDDYIHPRMFEILLKNAIETNADISVGGYKNVRGHQDVIDDILDEADLKITTWNGKDFLTQCLLNGVDKKTWVLWDKIYRRSCFEHIRMPEGRIYEDNAVVYKILYEANTVVDCNAPFYYYFQNSSGTTNQAFSKKHLDCLLIPKEMCDYFALNQDEILWDKANRMYLHSLENMCRRVQNEFKDKDIFRNLKKELKEQFRKEKKRYHITMKTHPGIYEILYPLASYIYWTMVGALGKKKRK